VTVFNGRCTHLGCAYNWRTEGRNTGQFLCPCHDGVFSLDGTVQDGPPPRPLDTLAVQVEDGVLMVTYQDFRLGVPDKAPV
jgi:menaquinol-cytochrome c reductase iron-sulfur subunit